MPTSSSPISTPPEGPRLALPGDGQAPIFAAPWEAQVFALVVSLHRQGLFTWPEWAEALGREIAAAGRADTGERYYEHWLSAFERLLAAKNIVPEDQRKARETAWDRAARATPHGQPVVLPKD
ncbi:MAG: nitrile hydratase accessory protein [Parvibaculaceae bacterium]